MTLDVETTIESQYANSPTILTLIDSFSQSINPQINIDKFYDFVWNVNTAQGYGLDVWGRIVGVTRTLTINNAGDFLGWKEAGFGAYEPFGQGPWYSPGNTQPNFALSDTAFRELILVKALSNISNCSSQTINKALTMLFPDMGEAFILDTGNMTARLIFGFALQPYQLAILQQSGALALPTGVGVTLINVEISGRFGFGEAAGSAPFNQGTFFGGQILDIQ